MKKAVKLGLLGAIIAGVFSACSSEPKSVEYYSDPKNAKELEAKVTECKKKFPKNSEKTSKELEKSLNGNPSNEFLDCENAHKANNRKSEPQESMMETMQRLRDEKKEKGFTLE
ncbi:hypothetical protein CCZ01_00905 [Helicobacter monodelphidis]|uniref:hypothetical protein n=1 Tax=Helicobacter sp. 15-1451 TaxID=2004995 RepID=UPI000DCCD8AE|nr:hypothetical protein [Helicobacter sp. 15-1451]RAX59325.1 hypothetical protein CCZ01_00905 [Helicobacter sp. 15-1451]